VLVGFFIGMQVSDIASNSSKIERQIAQQYGQAMQLIAEKSGVSPEQQQQMLQKQQQSSSGKMSGMITGFLAGLGGVLTNTLLVLVYIFLFMYFRYKIKGFIMRLVPKGEEQNALETIHNAQKVSQSYLG